MCETGKEIKLCTCFPATMDKVVHHKNSRKSKNKRRNDFTWTLERCLGPSKYTMDGMGYLPDKTLSEDLTTEKMLIDLNSKNCFDFDYEPAEGDNLTIYTPENNIRKHLSFIFQNEEWIDDYYLPFKYEMKKINYGKVIFEDKNDK
ncbi:hypothetical protein [Flavobacterium sp. SLB02]|uniref:hypothetical protein n=1 Tax=Flavobacterium sp. SLB02 TaxID=2665645 RepID=UPI0012A7F1E9|nr:hypothetical protein [Flavobacterium sp. SLB02]QGK74237.1 hypothetical protein GIY83_09270 [Flavobacterium sp. SLB02]